MPCMVITKFVSSTDQKVDDHSKTRLHWSILKKKKVKKLKAQSFQISKDIISWYNQRNTLLEFS